MEVKDLGLDRTKLGLVHVYTGNGKGKTTSSLGAAMRAIGHEMRVYMVQFMKMGYTGEIINAKRNEIPLDIEPFNVKCVNDSAHQVQIRQGKFEGYCRSCFCAQQEYDREKALEAFEHAKAAVCSGLYDMVIMDEINVVLSKGLLETEKVLGLIEKKHPYTELILTGRNAPREVMEKAHYVTEMRAVKHPMEEGVLARKGIEF